MGKSNELCSMSLSFPEEITLSVICGKWKFRILYRLADGPKRFNELQRMLTNIAPRTLTNQLRELEDYGIIKRKEFPQIPPKVEYSLTKTGETLLPTLDMLSKWGSKYCSIIEAEMSSKKK